MVPVMWLISDEIRVFDDAVAVCCAAAAIDAAVVIALWTAFSQALASVWAALGYAVIGVGVEEVAAVVVVVAGALVVVVAAGAAGFVAVGIAAGEVARTLGAGRWTAGTLWALGAKAACGVAGACTAEWRRAALGWVARTTAGCAARAAGTLTWFACRATGPTERGTACGIRATATGV